MAKNIVPLQVRRATIELSAEITLDCYTADEQRTDGSFINYLSGRGIAKAVEMTNKTVTPKTMSKGLKAFLGADFMVTPGCFELSKGRTSEVDLWEAKFCSKAFLFFASRGNSKAVSITDALMSASLDTVANDKFGRTPAAGATLSSAQAYFRDTPKVWDLHFDDDWQKEACRTLKLKWQGRAMAKFIVTYVYRELGIWEELRQLNSNPRRYRYHQYLTSVASEDVVKKHIHAVYMVLAQSISRKEFKVNWENYRNGIIQGRLF